VLLGRDLFADLPIPEIHLRVGIERELRAAMLGLRRAVAGGDPSTIEARVKDTMDEIHPALYSLLSLQGTRPASLYEAAARTYDVALDPLERAAADPRAALGPLMTLLSRAVNDVDRPGDWS
jgi:hypothetical protein